MFRIIKLIIAFSFSLFQCIHAFSQDCTCKYHGPDLVYNGDFSLGNTGFSTSYTFSTRQSNPLDYGIATHAQTGNGHWGDCRDHTSGEGNFMWLDLASTSLNMWSQTIKGIKAHTNYTITYWVCNLLENDPGTWVCLINDQQMGGPITTPPVTCVWIKYCIHWNSGRKTSATLTFKNQSTYGFGNDIALDDISFQECSSDANITNSLLQDEFPDPKTENNKQNFSHEGYYISGKVIESATNQPVRIKLYLKDEYGDVLYNCVSASDGSFFFENVNKVDYYLCTKDEKHEPFEKLLERKHKHKDELVVLNTKTIEQVASIPLKKDSVYVLHNVVFSTNNWDLLPTSFEELNKLIKMMKNNPSMRIRLEGHTDPMSNAFKSKKLSLKRVKNVKKYLVAKGIRKKRIKTIGFGDLKIKYNYSSQENRRVEFVILSE